MPDNEHTEIVDPRISTLRGWLSYRVSLRVNPILLVFVLMTFMLAGSAITLVYARQSRLAETKTFNSSDPKSLADFLAALCAQSFRSSLPAEAPFLAENITVMSKMMTAMAITPSGNIDKDFAAMMEPHHQAAIDMAVIELRYGANPILRRLAQEIIVEQQQEISAMRLALNQPLPVLAPAPDQVSEVKRSTR